MKTLSLLKTVLLMSVIIAVSACSRDGYQYTGYHNIGPHGWAYGSPLEFDVSQAPSPLVGNIIVSVTNDNSYPYRNLWLEVTYDSTDGARCCDTVNIAMCDLYGNWYGNGLPGHYQLSDTITVSPVTVADSSLIRVRHIMRVDTIRGISQVGLSIL